METASSSRCIPPALSVLVPFRAPVPALDPFLTDLVAALEHLGEPWEIVVLTDRPITVSAPGPIRIVTVPDWGYGRALDRGLAESSGGWVLTIEPAFRHDPGYIARLWTSRHEADVVIASRYVRFGLADMPWVRWIASMLINAFYRRLLSLEIHDLTSSLRLYRRPALREIAPFGSEYDALLEILVKLDCSGFRIVEAPFHYRPPGEDSTLSPLGRFGLESVASTFRLWRIRNSIFSADYDHRAFYSWVVPQRMWQRRRYQVVHEMVGLQPGRVADLGCGTSMIVMGLPGCVSMDIQLKKLRFLRHLRLPLLQGSLDSLPLASESFDTVICSQVIEHVPRHLVRFDEMNRILRPGGRLVIGTPDYGTRAWRFTEAIYQRLMPGGYADEHVTHFTRESLAADLAAAGFSVRSHRYVYTGELVMAAEKVGRPRD